MTAMLEDDGIWSRLTPPLSARDVSRLSFLAGLHDAGKANNSFQTTMRLIISRENRGLKPRKTEGHCGPLLAIVANSSADWQPDPLLSGQVYPASLEPCMAVHRVLRPTRRSRWFSGTTAEVWYWRALLAHHMKPSAAILPEHRTRCPDPALWRDTDHYSPRAALKQLVRAMGAAHPRVHERGKGRLPGNYHVVVKFALLVQLADRLSSEHFPYPGANVPSGEARIRWALGKAKALVEAKRDHILRASDIRLSKEPPVDRWPGIGRPRRQSFTTGRRTR